jgi:hypothetical protein
VLLIIAGVLVGPASCGVLLGTAGMAMTEDTTPRAESPAPAPSVPGSAPSVEDPYAKLRKEPGFISRDDLGEQWPLTVDAGVVSCESHGGGGTNWSIDYLTTEASVRGRLVRACSVRAACVLVLPGRVVVRTAPGPAS